MSDKDYKKLYEAGVKLLDHKPTKQEALKSLMDAGILDKMVNLPHLTRILQKWW